MPPNGGTTADATVVLATNKQTVDNQLFVKIFNKKLFVKTY